MASFATLIGCFDRNLPTQFGNDSSSLHCRLFSFEGIGAAFRADAKSEGLVGRLTEGDVVDDEARNLPEPGVKAEKVVPEDGPSVEPGNTLATKRASVATEKAEPVTDNRPAYGFWLAVLALVLVSLVAVAALVIFRTVFENASDVTTVLTALFTVMGTLVGTYFGIKTSGDTRDKLQDSIDKAHETANRALAELPPEAGRRVTQEGQQPHGA